MSLLPTPQPQRDRLLLDDSLPATPATGRADPSRVPAANGGNEGQLQGSPRRANVPRTSLILVVLIVSILGGLGNAFLGFDDIAKAVGYFLFVTVARQNITNAGYWILAVFSLSILVVVFKPKSK